MRAALVLLLGVLAIVGVIKFYPSSEVEGAGEDSAAEEEEAQAVKFLTRDQPADPPPVPVVEEPVEPAPEPAVESVFGIAWEEQATKADEAALATALLYGTPADVEAALRDRSDLDEPARRLYLSFAEALAGNRGQAFTLAKGLDQPDLLGPEERRLLEAALAGSAAETRTAAAPTRNATAAAMEMRLLWREAHARLDAGEHQTAARAFSDLLVAGLQAPWEAPRAALLDWTEGLRKAQARHRWDPRSDWASVEMIVQPGDTLTHIRKRYLASHPGGLLCTGQVEKANRLVGFLQEDQKLRIPTDRAHALVDLSSRWMLYFLGDEVAAAYEVGIGREGEDTITGTFAAGEKQERPTWFRRGHAPAPYPDNPLGTRWIAWLRDGQKTGYGFHGTWEDESIGQAASDGCIRLRNEEVEELFSILPVGATIRVQD